MSAVLGGGGGQRRWNQEGQGGCLQQRGAVGRGCLQLGLRIRALNTPAPPPSQGCGWGGGLQGADGHASQPLWSSPPQ